MAMPIEEVEPEMMILEEDQDVGNLEVSLFRSSRRKRDLMDTVATIISQEVKSKGFPSTPVAYFGAVFSTLKSMSQNEPDPSALEALLTFLSTVLPALPPAVLRSEGGEVGVVVKSFVEVVGVSDGIVKAVLKCVSWVLVGGEKGKWEKVEDLYRFLLGFSTDKREKVRMQAHSCLRDVLQSFDGTFVLSYASEEIVVLFLGFLSVAGGSNCANNVDPQGPRGVWEVLFLLNVLKDCLPFMSTKSRFKILKYMKSLLLLQQPIVTRAIVGILHSLCLSVTNEVPGETLLDLLCFLASSATNKERSADSVASIAHLLLSGMKKIYSINRSICGVRLPEVFSALGEILACKHEEAIFASIGAFKGLIHTCICKTLIDEGMDGVTRSSPTSIKRICVILEGLLGYRYSDVWDLSFQIISAMFNRLEESSYQLMSGVIESMANLEKLSDENLHFRKQLHECIGSAIIAMGPEMFLQIIPLNLESNDMSDTNCWLLPILKQYTIGAKLSFFKQTVLVVADRLQQRSQELERDGLIVSARATKGIVYSLWSLLPSFCNYPSDTASSFKDLHKQLCDTFRKEADFRGLICSSLQILIQQNNKVLLENNKVSVEMGDHEQKAWNRYTLEVANENLDVLRSFAKGNAHSIISVLSEIFLESSNDSGKCLQSAINEYASIMDKKDVKKIFKKIISQLLIVTKEADSSKDRSSNDMQIDGSDVNALSIKRAQLLDLALCFLPGLGIEEMKFLMKHCITPGIKDNEGIIQKKAYKTLSTILKDHRDFLVSKLDEIRILMLDALPSCHLSAKRYRLDSLYFLIVYLSKGSSVQSKQDIISPFLTEIILALKEDNKKTRNRAYTLLVDIGHACGDEEHGGKKESLLQFFNMVVGCLALEKSNMISAAVKGLARLAYEFSDLISAAYSLLPSAFLLIQRKDRQICKANLGLLKVLVAKSQADSLHVHLNDIVQGLLKWQDDTKNHFKAKVKLLFEMLVKKCGMDAVKEVMPEEHMKLLTNIRKITEHKEKKYQSEKDTRSLYSRASSRASRWNHTDIFSDDDGETHSQSRALTKVSSLRSKKTHRSSKRLPGDLFNHLEDDPLDLLDGQRTRAALESSSHRKRKVESDDGEELEINDDGRLVISEGGKKMKKERNCFSDNDLDIKSNSGRSAHSLTKAQKKKQKTESGWSFTGIEYTSKKAKGDIKRKNKLEPYAYWPLDRKLLNRRENNKAIARKGMVSVMKVTKSLEGKSASSALGVKFKSVKYQNKSKTKKHK